MPPSAEPPDPADILLRLREVTAPLPGGGRIGPISWTIARKRRVRFSCEEGQWEALLGLLTGRIRPASGILQEGEPVRVQTDRHLKASLDLNRTIGDYLHSSDAPEFVWLNNRRRSLGVLADLLGILPHMTRRALKLGDGELQNKYWALRFMVSQAGLLIGREVFQLPDRQVRTALRARWGDFPGTVIAGVEGAHLPGPVDSRAGIERGGRFSLVENAPGEIHFPPGEK